MDRRALVASALFLVVGILLLAAFRCHHMSVKRKAAQEAALKADLRVMRDVLDQHFRDKGCYPPSLDALVEAGYLRAVPVDPMTRSSSTWQVRLEGTRRDSLPRDPCPGVGVIDVSSGSGLFGSDGVPHGDR